ncbi:MAG: hypothetical protein A2817_00350 [Candidatus Yanofskybacteria bacterium RIFCSPHIGHO2_01_FULL_39_8b]|uniref:Amidohydrolase-related domain-containing protein n=1 Tax=Candidatus Yanofskybacteria bacterium RIFCSPHIGHO2_01_FULL_39_8b TaxID=1802659 RepID=A0A1F8EGX3_9BACT|nr:MAG: hypothetical protein A2817_00350 [Candidatus Yanofskybacteria bacterium RIFCSPHIGHO2_01_FULL_39_8b]
MIIDSHTHIGKLPNSIHSESYQKNLGAIVGEDHKLLHGTDWPLCHMEQYIKFAKNLGFYESKMEKLFSGNAQKLFKL